MGQNALGQSRCKICKSTVSQEKNDEKAFIFCVFIQIHGN